MRFARRLIGLLTAGATLVGAAGVGLAHDGWVQSPTPIVRVGEVAYADLLFGNHSNEHKSYRIAGKWSMSTSKVYVTGPDGTKSDITATVFDTGEANDVSPTGTKGYYTASFIPSAPGLYVVSAEGDSLFQHDDVTIRTLRSAKTFVAAADVPIRERVAALTAYTRAVTPDRAELIPHVNPVALTAGDQIKVQLVHKGQPVPGEHVAVIRRSTSETAEYHTDADGIVTFPVPAPDFYLIRAEFDKTDEKEPGKYDQTSYEATLVLVVQRGGQLSPAFGSKGVSLWVNDKELRLAEGDGAPQVVGDRAFVPVRAAAEALGASVGWDDAAHTVTVTRGGVTVQIPVGKAEAVVGGRSVALDAPAFMDPQVNRTMVPVRFLAQAFGANVEYL
ncbi:MAG: DUF4198 domain-containing protein, partial [Clostridia bacterium]|nr:DUF4198 domain-containing protein [Clostridia bacterium]